MVLNIILKRFIAAALVLTLHFAPYISSLSKVRNRYFRFWELSDGLAIVADIVVLAALAVGFSVLIDKFGTRSLRKLYYHLFLIALGAGVISNIPCIYLTRSTEQEVLWFGLIAVTAYSLGRPSSRLISYAAVLCLVGSPLIPILLLPMLTWKSWNTASQAPAPPRRRSDQSHPIFFFVFDEWSYGRSTKRGEFLDSLPNIRRLAAQSVVFHQAYSPSDTTYNSLPMLIYQSDNYASLPGVFVGHRSLDQVNEADRLVKHTDRPNQLDSGSTKSLFSLARDHNYNTYLLGFYLPYCNMLGDQVDSCRAYSFYPKGTSFLQEMEVGALESLRYFPHPIGEHAWRHLYARAFTQRWFDLHDKMQQDLRSMIEQCPDNTFAVVHWPLPHAPFVFNSDGSHKGPYAVDFSKAKGDDEDRMNGTPEGYQRQLEFLDLSLGRIIDDLQASGKFDNALLIVTSDHSWRTEKDPNYLVGVQPREHVPLIIKLPKQDKGHVIQDPILSVHLRPIIERVLQGNAESEAILRIIYSVTGINNHKL